MKNGVAEGDRIVWIQGWWLLPIEHPRHREVFERRIDRYTGEREEAGLRAVDMIFVRKPADPTEMPPISSPTDVANTEERDAATSLTHTPTEIGDKPPAAGDNGPEGGTTALGSSVRAAVPMEVDAEGDEPTATAGGISITTDNEASRNAIVPPQPGAGCWLLKDAQGNPSNKIVLGDKAYAEEVAQKTGGSIVDREDEQKSGEAAASQQLEAPPTSDDNASAAEAEPSSKISEEQKTQAQRVLEQYVLHQQLPEELQERIRQERENLSMEVKTEIYNHIVKAALEDLGDEQSMRGCCLRQGPPLGKCRLRGGKPCHFFCVQRGVCPVDWDKVGYDPLQDVAWQVGKPETLDAHQAWSVGPDDVGIARRTSAVVIEQADVEMTSADPSSGAASSSEPPRTSGLR